MARLWKNTPGISEGKYLVTRRDGTVPEWPWFVLGARDPAAVAALIAYAASAERNGYDPAFVADIRAMAQDWEEFRFAHGNGDADAPPHRVDDPTTVARMATGRGA